MLAAESAAQGKGRRPAPVVKVAGVKLAHAPTEAQLGVYLCDKIAEQSMGDLAELGEIGCSFFGPKPKHKDLEFEFDLDIQAENPSPIPIPLVQLLVAFTAFPGHGKLKRQGENLGAICLSLCKDPKNCQQQADACKSDQPEIKDLKSFEYATANFLISVALGEKKFEDLKIQTIPPHKTIHFDTRLALSIDQMMNLMGHLADDAISAIKHKKNPHFIIPYKLEGSAWVTVENFGRFAASIPPLEGKWDLAKL